MLSPDGRVIMVSGASRGIGLAVARALHAKGYSLSLGARRRDAVDTAIADIADGRIMTQAYDEMWAVNVKGPLRLIRLTMPYLKQSGSGRIVNIASLSGKRVKGGQAGYPMSKFAVMALTQAARRAGWDHGIRVTAICPGYVATDMTADAKDVAARDMIQAEDLAELVATVIALPNTASVAEVPINCVLEDIF